MPLSPVSAQPATHTLDRISFFSAVRDDPFPGHMTTDQVGGLTHILDYFDAHPIPDVRWRAYMLATTYHETAATMQPVEEYGHGVGRPYALGGWWGRGLVQLTWQRNYAVWAKRLGVDLVAHPALAMTWPVALPILVDGMSHGVFTGVGLGRYFNATTDDAVGARRVVNGQDQAAMVANYHYAFLDALG